MKNASNIFFLFLSSVYLWHAHSRKLVFKNLHIGQRYTIPRSLISYRTLHCTHTFAPPCESSFNSICHSSSPSSSTVTTAASRSLTRSITACSHHRIPTHAPGSHGTNIGVLGWILNLSLVSSMASSQ